LEKLGTTVSEIRQQQSCQGMSQEIRQPVPTMVEGHETFTIVPLHDIIEKLLCVYPKKVKRSLPDLTLVEDGN
jgi:hypothetical protein